MLGSMSRVALLALCACRINFDELPLRDDALSDGATGEEAVFAVGAFPKRPATGVQVISHMLGTTPRAIVMWSSGSATAGFSPSTQFVLGFVDQDRISRSVAIFSQDNVAGVSDRRMSLGALTFVGDNAMTTAEAIVTQWDESTFTLDWSVNNLRMELVFYLLIGGPVSSRVVGWTMPDTLGPLPISGVGFMPDVVLHAHAQAGFVAAPPASFPQAGFGLGAMTATGQWGASVFIADGAGATNTQRGARTDACIHVFDANELELRRGKFASMDAQGFTLDFDVVGAAGTQAFSLALTGVRAYADSFPKPTVAAPTDAIVQGLPFQPGALVLASVQDLPRTMPVPHARFGLGAAYRRGVLGAANSVTFTDTDGLAVASVDSHTTLQYSLVKVDNDTASIDAAFGLPVFGADGFTIPLPTNDAVATQIHYLVLGPK